MAEKVSQDQIRRMFSSLAPEYDRFNFWSSLGMVQRWRRALAAEIAGRRDVLDLGAGTGELARLVLRGASVPGVSVAGADLSFEMLSAAQGASREPAPRWVQASAEFLPFNSGSFDAVVSAYVMRNLYRAGILGESLREILRVLRPSGRIVFLDLTRPAFGPLRWGHGLYTRSVMPLVGRCLFGGRWPGDYLKSSIEELPSAEGLRELFGACGFRDLSVRPLTGGIVSLFSATKS